MAPTEYSTNFEFEQREEKTTLRVASRKGLITREQLHVWLTDFAQIFQDILEHPQRSVLVFPTSLQSLPLASGSAKGASSAQDETEPGPDLECIRTALSEVSGLPPEDITPNASIFSLGLDSISAIRVAATCRKQAHGVSVADVLQGRSLGGICRRLRERIPGLKTHAKEQSPLISAESRSKALVLANVKDEDVEDVLPCLAGQVYHLARWLKSGRTMGEAVWPYRSSKRLGVDGLKSAWRGLRERHSVLRTTFVAVSPTEALQVVLKPLALTHDSFTCVEILNDDSKDGVVTEQIERVAKKPFDLLSPPSALHLLRGETQDVVLLKLHHATYDAWTVQPIIDDLAALYKGTHFTPPPPFAPFIHHTIRSLRTDAETHYWRQILQNGQRTLLQPPPPTSHATTTTTTTAFIHSAIPNLSALTDLSARTALQLPALLLLAIARSLSRLTAVANPTLGLYHAGRSAPHPGLDQLRAPCVNVLPVAVPGALGAPVVESARRLQEQLAAGVGFEQSFLSEVVRCGGDGVEDGGGNRDFSTKPLFNTYVNILSSTSTETTTAPTLTKLEPLFLPYQSASIPMGAVAASATASAVGEEGGKKTSTTAGEEGGGEKTSMMREKAQNEKVGTTARRQKGDEKTGSTAATKQSGEENPHTSPISKSTTTTSPPAATAGAPAASAMSAPSPSPSPSLDHPTPTAPFPSPSQHTPISPLLTTHLSPSNLYIDIVRNVEDDCLDFGLRCDGGLMDEGGVRAFAGRVSGEMEVVVGGF